MSTPIAEAGWQWIHEEQAVLGSTAVFSGSLTEESLKGVGELDMQKIPSLAYLSLLKKMLQGKKSGEVRTVGEGERKCWKKKKKHEAWCCRLKLTRVNVNEWVPAYQERWCWVSHFDFCASCPGSWVFNPCLPGSPWEFCLTSENSHHVWVLTSGSVGGISLTL